MNKPIRTVSIFCLLLFLALMVNATYLQYYHANALNDRSDNGRVAAATFSRARGAILAGPKGGTVIAQSVESQDQYKYQRVYKKPFMYAPITGWYTFGNQTGLERAQNSFLSGEDDSLFVNRLVDLVNGSATKGGNVLLTVDPAAQEAAYNGLRGLGPDVEGAVVAIEPSTGKVLAMVSLPSYDPNKLADHDFKKANAYASQLSKMKSQPLLNRAIQTTLPPGSTFKILTAGAGVQYDGLTANSLVPAGPTYTLPQSNSVVHNEVPGCADKITLTTALKYSCNTAFAPLAVKVGASDMHQAAEGFGFNQSYLERHPASRAGDLAVPRGHGRRRHRAVRLRSGIGHRQSAADGHGHRRHRQPRRRDEALRLGHRAVPDQLRDRAPDGVHPARPGDVVHDGQRGHQDDGRHRGVRHRRHRPRSPASRWRARPARPRAVSPRPTARRSRRTPGSSGSPRPTRPRSRWP